MAVQSESSLFLLIKIHSIVFFWPWPFRFVQVRIDQIAAKDVSDALDDLLLHVRGPSLFREASNSLSDRVLFFV